MTNECDDNVYKPNMERNITSKVFSYIGLAMKGGNLVSGEFACEKAIQSNQAFLVIVADDASKNTKKKFTNKCTYYDVPLYFFGTKQELGKTIGKELRSSIALTDSNLANGLELQLDNRCNGEIIM